MLGSYGSDIVVDDVFSLLLLPKNGRELRKEER